jgi:hypothetical protein
MTNKVFEKKFKVNFIFLKKITYNNLFFVDNSIKIMSFLSIFIDFYAQMVRF